MDMPSLAKLALAGLILLPAGCRFIEVPPDAPPVLTLGPSADLQAILDTARGPLEIELEPGDYHLKPVAFTDSTCGNCEDPDEDVPATRGLRLSGQGLHLKGTATNDVLLHTHAGYGVLFEDCDDCTLSGLTVTDGIRDPDGRATDAGVVVRGGAVTLSDCAIRDNLGDSAVVHSVVVGVAGIAVREDASVTVERCRIERNSWDGIAAYRGARLVARDNVVDGVDKAAGAALGGGRGVGIGLTWDARGRIEGNLVTRYWKGIGVFVDARAEVTENVVEDILTWGIAYWGPDNGRPIAVIQRNVVFETGACGASVDRSASWDATEPQARSSEFPAWTRADGPGRLTDNLLVRTGQNERYDSGEPYCLQRPVARHAIPDGFVIEGNLAHDVRQPGDAPVEVAIGRSELLDRGRIVVDAVSARPHLAASRFLGAFGHDRR